MGGITARYKRATAVLDERARARLWGGSGSESSASSSEADSAELADLIDSFYDATAERDDDIVEPEWDSETNCGGRVGRDSRGALEAALGESEDDPVADRIRVEVERAIKVVGSGSDGLRRRVVTRLRNKGFNAGVCESSWERSSSLPAGSHEYMDVIARGDGTARYIVEINIAAEFEIARPSTAYLELLQTLPRAVLVAKPEHLKEVVRVMCAAATESIKSAGMHVPPWRRKKYVLAKWFSSHTRAAAGNITEKDEGYSGGGRTTAVQLPGVTSDRRFCRMDIGWGANLVVTEKSAPTVYREMGF